MISEIERNAPTTSTLHPSFFHSNSPSAVPSKGPNGNLICISYINSSLSERPFGCISCPSPSSSPRHRSGGAAAADLTAEYHPALFFPYQYVMRGWKPEMGDNFPLHWRGEGYPPPSRGPSVTVVTPVFQWGKLSLSGVIWDLFERVITPTQGFLRGYKAALGRFHSAPPFFFLCATVKGSN